MSDWAEMALRTTILRCDIGSRGFGLEHLTSDHDHKGVCVEDFEAHLSLEGAFEQWGPTQFGVDEDPSYPQGLDLEIYSLRKFLHLAMKGNPNILCLLFTPKPAVITDIGRELQELRGMIISKAAAGAFTGYMRGQDIKLRERGRPRYVEAFGYDVKFAMHLLRIGYQGIELLQDQTITMPFPEGAQRDHLIDVREGKVSLDHVVEEARDLFEILRTLRETTDLPPEPNRAYLDAWMRETYWGEWRARAELARLFDDASPTIH